ncbi:interleukin-27 subunit beta [Engraulis encrasicolus]|uniref:interleukin-27 subunit beta n=1 Tax=Engraulis encrasicolus TaxID=184585 RepID=UPI002FD671D6
MRLAPSFTKSTMCGCSYFLFICIGLTALHTGLCEDSSAWPLSGQPRELFVALGSEVRVQCDATPGEGSAAGAGAGVGVEWRLNGSTAVGQHGSLLYLQSARLQDGGLYTCHRHDDHSTTGEGEVMERVHLRPGYPPSPPNVTCWAPSYPEKALCKASQATHTHLPTDHVINYRHWVTGAIFPCHTIPSSGDYLCEMKDLEMLARPYVVNITATNALGSATTLMSFDLEENVKPDPPVDVKVTPLWKARDQRRVLVEWRPPPTWPEPELFPLKYKVRYYWGSNRQPVEVDSYDCCSIPVEGSLRGGRTYHFQVSALMMMDIGLQSDWSEPISSPVPA